MEVAKKIGSEKHVRSTASLATETEARYEKVSNIRLRLGAAAFQAQRFSICHLLEVLSAQVIADGGDCLLLSTRVRYGETPLRLKTRSNEGTDATLGQATHLGNMLAIASVAEDTTAAKLVQIECKGSALFNVKGCFHLLTFGFPVGLACVDRCTGAV